MAPTEMTETEGFFYLLKIVLIVGMVGFGIYEAVLHWDDISKQLAEAIHPQSVTPQEPAPQDFTAKDPSPTLPECTVNHTANLTLGNNSTHSVYSVIIDGTNEGIVGPGNTFTRTLAAGTHTVLFNFSNSEQAACTVANPNLAQCSDASLSCRRDLQ